MLSFKEFLTLQLEYSEKVIQQLIDRWDEEEAIVRNYIQKFDRYKQSPLIVKKDLFQYPTFRDLETVVDAAETKSLRKKKQKGKIALDPEVEKENLATAIVDDKNVTIYLADDENKCIQHGKGYTFCIAKPGSGNMYNSYRTRDASTFHYVFFKNIPKSDDKHIMVLDVTRNGYNATFKDNATRPISWEEVVEIYEKYDIDFNQYKDVFKNKELTETERENLEMLKRFKTNYNRDRIWSEANEEQRLLILKSGEPISYSIWETLSKFERNEHLGVGPNITSQIADDLSDAEAMRYIKVRNTTIKPLMEHYAYSFNKWDSDTKYAKERTKELNKKLVKYIKKEEASSYNDYIYLYLTSDDYQDVVFLTELPSELKKVNKPVAITFYDAKSLKTLNNLPKSLIDLKIERCPELERIDFKGVENITKLILGYECEKLKVLSPLPEVGVFKLFESNLSKLPSLSTVKNLNVKYCHEITKLPLGDNNILEDFEIFGCNGLKHLDLTQTRPFPLDTVIIEGCDNLKSIKLPDDKMRILRISGNLSLNELHIHDSNLKFDDRFRRDNVKIGNNSSLTKEGIHGLSDEGFSKMGINFSPTMKGLQFRFKEKEPIA